MYTVAIITFCTFICVWESIVFYRNRSLEDIVIAVASGGMAMFLTAMKLSGVFA